MYEKTNPTPIVNTQSGDGTAVNVNPISSETLLKVLLAVIGFNFRSLL